MNHFVRVPHNRQLDCTSAAYHFNSFKPRGSGPMVVRRVMSMLPLLAPTTGDRMPQFFFDVLHDGKDVTRDHAGVDLPDLVAAKIEALEVWKRIITARAAGSTDYLHWRVAILDGCGKQLAEVPFPSEA